MASEPREQAGGSERPAPEDLAPEEAASHFSEQFAPAFLTLVSII